MALPSATTSGSVLKIEGANRTVPPSIVPIARCASGVSCSLNKRMQRNIFPASFPRFSQIPDSLARRQKPFVIKKMQRSVPPASFPRFSQIPDGIAQCDNLRQRVKNRGCKPHCSAVYRPNCTMCQRCTVQPSP